LHLQDKKDACNQQSKKGKRPVNHINNLCQNLVITIVYNYFGKSLLRAKLTIPLGLYCKAIKKINKKFVTRKISLILQAKTKSYGLKKSTN
jgi:hypothetical protein